MFLKRVRRLMILNRMNIIPAIVILAVVVSIVSFAIFSEPSDVSANMAGTSEPTREVATTQVSTSAFIKKVTTLPTTTQPTTQAPTTEVPTTATPTTMASTTQPPTTAAPTTAAPTTAAPTTQPPTTQPPTTEIPEVEDEEDDVDYYESSGRTYLGTYSLTAYCPCYSCSEGWGRQTSSGYTCTAGRTVACNSIPPGTWIYIEGYGEYRVEDTGGGLGSNTIDIFFDEHWETEQFGRRSAAVYLLN